MLPKTNNDNDLFSEISFLSINRNFYSLENSEISPENSLNLLFESPGILNIFPRNELDLKLKDKNKMKFENKKILFHNNSNQNFTEDLIEKKEIIKKPEVLEETSKSTKKSTKKQFILKNKKSIVKKLSQKENKKSNNRNCLIRKTKKIIINTSINYINKIILKVYNGKIGNGLYQKFLRKVNRFENNNTKIIHNRELLNKTLKEILSADINGRYTSSPADINREIINKLLKEENEDKRKIFVNLFNKTFLDWLMLLSEPKDELKEIYEKELEKSTKGKIYCRNFHCK